MAGAPMVIRARVRARLLGLRLLTLDACITADSDGAGQRGPAVRRAAGDAAGRAG